MSSLVCAANFGYSADDHASPRRTSPRKSAKRPDFCERKRNRSESNDKYTDADALGALRSPIRGSGSDMRRGEGRADRSSRDGVARAHQGSENDFPQLRRSPRTHRYSTGRQKYTSANSYNHTTHQSPGSRKSLWGDGPVVTREEEWINRRVHLGKGEKLEEDPVVLERKQKTIMYGKNTEEYKRYISLIPRHRRRREDPKTPEKFVKCTRRSWDQQIKIWRRKLHHFDSPIHEDEDWENLDPGTAFDIDDADNRDAPSSVVSPDTTGEVTSVDSDIATVDPDDASGTASGRHLPCPFVPKNLESLTHVSVTITGEKSPPKPKKQTVTLNWRASLMLEDSNDCYATPNHSSVESHSDSSQGADNAKTQEVPPFDYSLLSHIPDNSGSSTAAINFSTHAEEMSRFDDGFLPPTTSPRKRCSATTKSASSKDCCLDYDLKGLSWADLVEESN